MLVLARKVNDTLDMIVPPSTKPTKITVIIVEVKQSRTRLGIEAPKEVAIIRSELLAGGQSIKTG